MIAIQYLRKVTLGNYCIVHHIFTLVERPAMLDQVHPFTHQTAPGCRARDSVECEFPLSYRGEQYQCTGQLVDRGNPALCPAAMQDYTGTLAAHLKPGEWGLCPRDCNLVVGR